MFRPLSDHHQGVCNFLVKVIELKCNTFLVVMRSITYRVITFCSVWGGMPTRHTSPHGTTRNDTIRYAAASPHETYYILIHFNSVTLTRKLQTL
jgi:hypothetical protein